MAKLLNSERTTKRKSAPPKKLQPLPITKKQKLISQILPLFSEHYKDATIALHYTNALELLIATMLSAQCTDERVNKVTEQLFKKYTSPEDYYNVPQEELEKDIFSTGFYKAKAKNIQVCCRQIVEQHNGAVPGTIDELTALAGVGRKTANVVLGHWFGIPGMVVDTHVTRIANLLGLADTNNAEILERELGMLVPQDTWVQFTHYMISHGRSICVARRPRCGECFLQTLCRFGSSKTA
jgi:endonuclease-3